MGWWIGLSGEREKVSKTIIAAFFSFSSFTHVDDDHDDTH